MTGGSPVTRAAGAVVVVLVLALAGCAGGATTDDGAGSATGSDAGAPAPLTVDTSSGTLHGLATPRSRQFLGVRYAAALTQRWTLPQPPAKADGVVDATRSARPCAQAGVAPGADATASTTEDCLFADITTPRHIRPGAKLPVMVWSHGGGYTSGSAAVYDAQRLASDGNVIVVTVNKRLGVFGYLGLPGLAGGGDFGLADVVAALKWSKVNAAAFGGDPDNITLFGESDGAMSSCALLTSPQAGDLFDKLALSSGGTCQLNWPRNGLFVGMPPTTPYASRDASDDLGMSEARKIGCAGSPPAVLDCLRRAPVSKLMTIFPVFSDVLAYGTPLLPDDPAAALRAGNVAHVPVLSGSNQNEQNAFVGGALKANPNLITAQAYPTLVREAYGAAAPRVLDRYPPTAFASPALAFATMITDSSWACPTVAGNAALVRHGNPVYGYEFADPNAPDVNGAGSRSVPQGAAHATDLPYLFDLGGKSLLHNADQRRLAATMISYWTSFARDGKPTAPGAPRWQRLTGPDGPTLQLGPTIKPVDVGAEHHCDFWAGIST